jgi:hypothetical protein
LALESLNTFLGLPAMMWALICVGCIIAGIIVVIIHEVFIMNSFAKQARKMKRSKGAPCLIQDNNVLRLMFSDGQLPEGLYHVRGQWYTRPQTPYLSKAEKGPGRPPKGEKEQGDTVDVLKKDHREALNMVLQVPILEGVGKPLFIGCVSAPMLLNNVATVAHVDLTRIREILPATLSQTWLDALNVYSVAKGMKKANKDNLKLLYIAIAAAIPIACLGLVVFLILNGGK